MLRTKIIACLSLIIFVVPAITNAASIEEGRAALEQIKLSYTKEAFLKSIEEGDALAVELFVDAGMSPNLQDDNGMTILMSAAARGDVEVVEVLLAKGAEVNKQNKNGVTALMLAANKGYIDVLQVLLENKAAVNAKDNNGVTALTLARGNNHTQVMRKLLASGATDTRIKPEKRRSATMSWW